MTIVWISGWRIRSAVRAVTASRPGTPPTSLTNESRPAARPLFFSPSICSRTIRSRRSGSSSPHGRSHSSADTRFARIPRSPGDRTETGTRARTTVPGASAPRAASRSRKPEVAAASATSLTDPPNARRMRSTSSIRAQARDQRRAGTAGPFSSGAPEPMSRAA